MVNITAIRQRRDYESLRAAKELILVSEIDIRDTDIHLIIFGSKVEAELFNPLEVRY